MRVTVKRNARDTGLRRLWSSQRGAEVRIDGHRVGAVSRTAAHGSGWYFSVGDERYDLAHKNTANEPLGTYEEAKAAAIAYVKANARLASQFRVEVPISGTLVTTVYASSMTEANAKGRQRAADVVAALPTAISWDAPATPRATELPGEDDRS